MRLDRLKLETNIADENILNDAKVPSFIWYKKPHFSHTKTA